MIDIIHIVRVLRITLILTTNYKIKQKQYDICGRISRWMKKIVCFFFL